MRAVVATVACVVLVAGCRHDEGARVDANHLPMLVLQAGDLGAPFVAFDVGRQVGADAPTGARADPNRFGREGGWKARFRRRGSPQTRGPLVVESRADVFGSTDGAAEDLAAHRDELEAAAAVVAVEDLGDDAFAARFEQVAATGNVAFVTVAWRRGNVSATVLAQGFRLSIEQAVELARKQDARIERAAQ